MSEISQRERELLQQLSDLRRRVERLETKEPGSGYVALTGAQTVAGDKTLTGNFIVQDARIYGRYSTYDSLVYVATAASTISVANGQTFSITLASGTSGLILVDANGRQALLLPSRQTATIIELADTDGIFTPGSAPAADNIGYFKSAGSTVISFKSAYASARSMFVVVFGTTIVGYSAPA